MQFKASTVYALIVTCEFGFWLALFGGLALRYLRQWNRAGWLLLACVPLIDVALLALTVADLRSGTTATVAHGLAAAYVGLSVSFGALMVRWADQRFAHRFGDGPPPVQAPTRGWACVRHEFTLWARCILAAALTWLLLLAAIAFVDDPERTQALRLWFRIPIGSIFFWFIFGPLWSLVFFKRARTVAENALP
jgi:hypothetical protein